MKEATEHVDQGLELVDGKDRLVTEAIALQECAFVRIQNSEYEEAVKFCQRARRSIEKRGLFFEYTVYTYPRMVEALLGPTWTLKCDESSLRQAKRICWASDFVGWRFPNIRPIALRVRGRLMAALGRHRKASRYFEHSIEAATKVSADYERARAMLDLAAVAPEQATKLRGEAIAILREKKGAVPEAEKWLLGEQTCDHCVARQHRASSATERGRRGMTVIESLVVIVIVSVSVGRLLPAVQPVRASGSIRSGAAHFGYPEASTHFINQSIDRKVDRSLSTTRESDVVSCSKRSSRSRHRKGNS